MKYPTKSDSNYRRYLRSNQANVQVLSCLFLNSAGNQAGPGLLGGSLDLLLSHGYVFFKFNVIFGTASPHVFFAGTTSAISPCLLSVVLVGLLYSSSFNYI